MTAPTDAGIVEKLEKATGPDRELDAQIFCARYKSAYPDETPEAHLEYARRCAPEYTSSIDAALTLVPEGWHIEKLHQRDPDMRRDETSVEIAPDMNNDDGWFIGSQTAKAKTIPLAIVIAALRTRSPA